MNVRLPRGRALVASIALAIVAAGIIVAVARGTVYGTLTVARAGVAPVVRVNEPVLAAVLATIKSLRGEVLAKILAHEAGIILGLRSKAYIRQGDWAVLVGTELKA